MSIELFARRSLLKAALIGAAVVGLPGLSRSAGAADAAALKPLSADDPQAKSLQYVEDSSKAASPTHQAGQMCSTCLQYQGKPGDARGGCNIYPGKSVNARGWCMVYAQKPKG